MTCIVGLEHNGEVYLGGDSAGIAGYALSIRSDEKVFKNGKFIMGFTTSFRMGQLLRYSFTPPAQKDSDDFKYLVTDFVDAVRVTYKEKGYGKNVSGEEQGGTFLFGYNKKLYSVQSDFQIAKSSRGFDAVGCGADVALGSLYSTKHIKKPVERLKLALEAASALNAGVAAPFVFAYVHPGNRLANIVGFSSATVSADVAKDVAMQVAAMAPVAVDKGDVDAETIKREIEVGKEQAREEGKPEEMLEKIAMGKLNKFYKESTLLNQEFIKDNKKTIAQYLNDSEKGLTLTGFKRIALS